MGEGQARRSRSSHRRGELGKAHHLPVNKFVSNRSLASTQLCKYSNCTRRHAEAVAIVDKSYLTWGTLSLSACALAASVVTVLLTRAVFEKAELRNGAARLVLNALENIVCGGEGMRGEGERRSEELKLEVDLGAFRSRSVDLAVGGLF